MALVKHKAQRVGVFIDTANLYHSAKNLYGSRVNFGKVVEDAVADRHLVRAIAYVITTETGEEISEQVTLNSLAKIDETHLDGEYFVKYQLA